MDVLAAETRSLSVKPKSVIAVPEITVISSALFPPSPSEQQAAASPVTHRTTAPSCPRTESRIQELARRTEILGGS
jgi:hypothetical protein